VNESLKEAATLETRGNAMVVCLACNVVRVDAGAGMIEAVRKLAPSAAEPQQRAWISAEV